MGGFGSPIHWLVIGIVALLLFGNRLPEVARSIGKAFREFKRGLSDISDEMGREDEDRRDPDRLDRPKDRDELHESESNDDRVYREEQAADKHRSE